MKAFWKDAEKTILIRESPEALEWEAYESGVRKTNELLGEVKHDVFVILDASRVHTVPKNALNYFSRANQNLPSHIAMRILVTKNTLLQALTAVLEKVTPDDFQDFYYTNTMEEAYEKIAQEKAKRQRR